MNLKPRITDVCFSLDCDVDKMKHLLTDIDDCTTGGKKSVCEYIALSEQINTITAILFDYCAKVKDQIQEIDELSDKATAESKEEFERQFQAHMNPPITQEPDTGKALEREVRENNLASEITRDLNRTAKLRAAVCQKILDPELLDEDSLNRILGYILELEKESEE